MIEALKEEAARLETAAREQATLIANAETQLASMRATFEQIRGGLITVRALIQKGAPQGEPALSLVPPPNGEVMPPPEAEAPPQPAVSA